MSLSGRATARALLPDTEIENDHDDRALDEPAPKTPWRNQLRGAHRQSRKDVFETVHALSKEGPTCSDIARRTGYGRRDADHPRQKLTEQRGAGTYQRRDDRDTFRSGQQIEHVSYDGATLGLSGCRVNRSHMSTKVRNRAGYFGGPVASSYYRVVTDDCREQCWRRRSTILVTSACPPVSENVQREIWSMCRGHCMPDVSASAQKSIQSRIDTELRNASGLGLRTSPNRVVRISNGVSIESQWLS
jgi:hypothetical protein